MRVCFFIPSLGDGGAQRQCVALLNALQRNPIVEAHLILLGSGVHDDSLDVSELNIHRMEVRNFANPLALAFVVRTLRRVRPDVLISWLHPADIWSYVATRLVRGIPWVMTERNSAYPDTFVYKARELFARRGAAAIVANSVAGQQLWEFKAPRSWVQMISNMVIDTDVPLESGVAKTDSVVCLSVGRLYPEKNTAGMAAAFVQFAAVHPEARLVVAGEGPQASDVAAIAECAGVADRIEFLGFRRDVPLLMSRARVLLSFSHHEGMPNVLMEAVTAGLPAVVSDIPEHRALLGSNYPYYVCLDATPEEAAGVIAHAWASGASWGEHFYSYARDVLATMAPENVTKAYTDMFAEVIACAATSDARRQNAHWGRRRK